MPSDGLVANWVYLVIASLAWNLKAWLAIAVGRRRGQELRRIYLFRPATRFIIALVLGLALLTWAASLLVYHTMRDWFERDVSSRAELAVSGARHGLLSHWKNDEREDLHALLMELMRDERILAATACAKDLSVLAVTGDFPEQFGCRAVGPHVRQSVESATAWLPWKTAASLPGGTVHVSAIPLVGTEGPVGFVVVVQDLSFIERREASVRWFLLIAFGFLAAAASAITIVAAHVSWRKWSDEIRHVLKARPSGWSSTRSCKMFGISSNGSPMSDKPKANWAYGHPNDCARR